MSQEETPVPNPQEPTLEEFLFSDEERAARWRNYRGSYRVITLTDSNGRQRDIHVNPLTEDRAAYYATIGQYDKIADLPLYLTEDDPSPRDYGVRGGVMGAMRRPGRTIIVYLNESGAARFISVPYADEMAAWKNVLDGEWAALERFEALDVPPNLVQWATAVSDTAASGSGASA